MKAHLHSTALMFLFIYVVYTYWGCTECIWVAIFLILVGRLFVRLVRKFRAPPYSMHFQDVDTMDGTMFEYYVAQLLIDRGYTNVSLTERYDYGVDIIAEKDGIRWGVQTKRYSGLVKAAAVRQVVLIDRADLYELVR